MADRQTADGGQIERLLMTDRLLMAAAARSWCFQHSD